jgi:hypothetical protein
MNSLYRALYFRTFVVFFIIIIPFLVLFTLGYDINLNKSSISQSLLVSIETLPRGSSVLNQNQVAGTTPTEIRAQNNDPITLDITQNNYFSEKFTFLSTANTVANISSLALIPQKPLFLSKANSGEEIITVLSDQLILIKKDNTFLVKNYTFSGIEKAEFIVENLDGSSLKNYNFVDIGGAYFFPDSQKLLFVKDDKWSFKNFDKSPFLASNIVKKNTLLMILTKENQLWLLDLDTNQLKFVDSEIFGLSKIANSDFIWILKGTQVYRVDNFNDMNFQISPEQKYHNFTVAKNPNSKFSFFEAKNVFQGVVLKYDSMLTYIPDYDNKQFSYLTNSAEVFETSGSTIFWTDDKGDLFANNLELKTEIKLGQLAFDNKNFDKISIFYYSPWKRIFVYSEDKTYTVWFDKNIPNSSILKYFPYSFTGGNCLSEVIEKNQFCIQDNSLVSYRNTRIW